MSGFSAVGRPDNANKFLMRDLRDDILQNANGIAVLAGETHANVADGDGAHSGINPKFEYRNPKQF
jgi:hypothetical protein